MQTELTLCVEDLPQAVRDLLLPATVEVRLAISGTWNKPERATWGYAGGSPAEPGYWDWEIAEARQERSGGEDDGIIEALYAWSALDGKVQDALSCTADSYAEIEGDTL